MNSPKKEIMRDKRLKFVELAEKRVNRIIKQLELIGNLANKSNYTYGKSDYKKIFQVIDGEVESMKRKFIDADENNRTKFNLNK